MYTSWYSDFDWDTAPASDWRCMVLAVLVYLAAVPTMISYMEPREPFQLRKATALHNGALSLLSFVMCMGTILELWRRYADSGTFTWFFCESIDTRSQGPLFFWSYIFYLSKFWEMLDTAFILVQKSRVPHFKLQVFHHAFVVPLTWLWCQQQQTLQWGGLVFNTMVHVFMYHYYALRCLRLPTPWKKWISKLQVMQFVTSFLCLIVTLYMLMGKWRTGGTCAGMPSLLYNCIFNMILLFEFIGIAKKNS